MAFGSSPGGYALQALANVLAGAGQGAQQADVLNQRWTGLAQQQQALQQQNAQRMADVPTLFKSLNLPVPEGAGQTPIPVADLMLKTAEARRMQGEQQQRSGQVADVLAEKHPELAQLVRAGVLSGKDLLPHLFPQEKFTPLPAGATPISNVTGQPPAGFTPPAPMAPPTYDPAKQSMTTSYKTGRPPEYTVHDLGPGRSALVNVQKQRLIAEGYQEGTPAFDRELGLRMESIVPLAPGGEAYRKSDIPAPGAPLPGAPQTVQRGGPVMARPAQPSGTDIKDAGDRNNIIQQLEGTAALVKTMPQMETAAGRGSLAVRGFIQGRTPFETLTPQEQAYVVTHENLRQLLIQAQMGLGPFRSPEMQAQLQNTIGRYWTPGTAERLTALAQLLRGQQGGISAAEQQGNRIPVHTPPPVTNPNQNPAETKGGGWKIERVQ